MYKSEIVDIVNVSCECHQSDILLKITKEILAQCPVNMNVIKCVVTDSPTPMLKYRHLLSDEYSHIVPLPCALHVANLLTKDICRLEGLRDIVKGNHKIVNSFMKSHKWFHLSQEWANNDRTPSTTPGAEPPRDARDSGSARSHSTHLETSSSDRPKWSPTRSVTRYQDQISVTCTRRTLSMPSFTRATHAQPSLSNFTRRDSNFGERTRSRGTTLGERNFPTSPQNKKTKLTHCSIYVPMRTISTSHAK